MCIYIHLNNQVTNSWILNFHANETPRPTHDLGNQFEKPDFPRFITPAANSLVAMRVNAIIMIRTATVHIDHVKGEETSQVNIGKEAKN